MNDSLDRYAVGIDLGTTCSRVGIWKNNVVEIIASETGNRNTLSCVAFTDQGCHVGETAKSQSWRDPTNYVFAAKRLIGRKFDDPSVQSDMKRWPFTVC